jgi:prevent-host-death family protein
MRIAWLEASMDVAVSEAKAQLTELVRRAEAGEEIVLTRHGKPVVRLAPVAAASTPEARRAIIDRARALGRSRALPGPCAARSQDFLYDDDGLPR